MKAYAIAFACTLYSISASASQYKFSVPRVSISVAEQNRVHPAEAIGYAVFPHGVKVPAYAISVPTGVDETEDEYHAPDVDCGQMQCTFDMQLKPELATQLRAYHITGTNEWVLAPTSWTRWQGAIGANGNTVLVMSDASGKSNLSLYTVPACYGCGLDAASIYFADAARKNKLEYDSSYSSTNVPLHKVQKNPSTVLFQYQLPQQYKTDGVAKYHANSDDIFQSLKVSIAEKDIALARAMLNFFLITHPD